ncbi:uncharacterized protein LOC126783000 isoform X2 [Argentina anserina]|nr:uncharacterized protein LOC126783000 isoform X2 [Potentilla anserina]
MDKLEGKIADVDVKFLFNRINIQKPAGVLNVDLGKNKVCGNDTTSSEAMVPSKLNSSKEHMNLETTRRSVDKPKLNDEKQISAVGLEPSEIDKTVEIQQDASSPKTILSFKGKNRDEELILDKVLPRKLDVEEIRSTNDVGDLDNRPTKVEFATSETSSDKRNSHEQRHVEVEENNNGRKSNASLEHAQPKKANMNGNQSSEHRRKINANGSYMNDLSFVASQVDERCKLKGLEDTIGTNKRPTKKRKPEGNTSIPSNKKLPNSSHGDDESKVQKASLPSSSIGDDKCKRKYGGESLVVDKDSKKKMRVDDKATNLPLAVDEDSKMKMKVGDKTTNRPLVVGEDSEKKMKVGDKATNCPLVVGEDSEKKMKVGDKATNLSLPGDKNSEKKMKVGDKAINLSLPVDKNSEKKVKVCDEATLLSGKPPRPSPRLPQSKAKKFDGEVLEVNLCADASNVFGNDNKASSPIAFGSDDSLGKQKAPLEKMNAKSAVKASRLSNGELQGQSTAQLQIKSQKLDGQVVEGTQRSDADKKKWFKNMPWQEKMQAANEQGTLILLQNLDPAYTSAEVEDIVQNGLGESCTAKMIQQTANSSPYSGRALVILKNRETAKKVVRKLEQGCLLLPNGRPLVASIAETSCSAEKKPKFFGHLVLDKLRHSMLNEREMREAVSTSHFSQPNTIEYDMSMEWCAQQEKTDVLWNSLFKQQLKEVRELKAKLEAK